MLVFKQVKDATTGKSWIETPLQGKTLLNSALLNKGTAFTLEERDQFNLLGKLPSRVETLDEQVARAYEQYRRYKNDLSRNIYLNNLRDRNETLFYRLLNEHATEMMPIIYTPIVGTAVKEYSREFRGPRGLYITYPDRHRIDQILQNRTHPEIHLIVATDGGGVLAIGDQGIGAMDIPIAKLMVYTLFGGIHPSATLPIMLDVGTNNEELLNDPLYLGCRHPRISDDQYDEFIDLFMKAVRRQFPQAFLHWEDLGQRNAHLLLQRYGHTDCSFNDDIQGTGAVTLAALTAAVKSIGQKLTQQRIVVFGAGSAGMGITEQITTALQVAGLTPEQARGCFWLVDRPGLLTSDMSQLTSAQVGYARKPEDVALWNRDITGMIDLAEVFHHVKPTVLIGCSTVTGAFHEDIVREMASYCERPIIFPLSNPTERAEAKPHDLIAWTQGRAIIATGSPFADVIWQNKVIRVPQCNNALVFPGIGLGVLAVRASYLSEKMIWAACEAIADCAPINQYSHAPVLPFLGDARALSRIVAVTVAKQAVKEGLARVDVANDKMVDELVDALRWQPEYLPFRVSQG